MKAWLIALLIAGMAGAATAREATGWDDALELCAVKSRVAGSVMDLRQMGDRMSQLVERFKDDAAMVAMVMAAYEVPRYSGEGARAQASLDFENDYYQHCLKELMRSP